MRSCAIKRALAGSVPLIGFAGSPFTLACYMIDGGAGGDFGRTRRLLYARPDLLQRVLSINADAVGSYLIEQVRHGADAVMIFDTWGGLLTADAYVRFSLAYIERVLAQLRGSCGEVPTIVFTKGGGQWLERIAACGCDAVGVDWTTDIGAARERIGARVAVQGNLDPQVLLDAAPRRSSARRARCCGPLARSRAIFSISATACCRKRHPRTSPPWLHSCTPNRASDSDPMPPPANPNRPRPALRSVLRWA